MSYSVKRPRCKQFFRVMRITTLLLFVFIFCMHAENSSSQNVNVTIKRSNTELENVLKYIIVRRWNNDYDLFVCTAG